MCVYIYNSTTALHGFKTEHNFVPYTQFCVFFDAEPWNLPNIIPLILEIIHQKLCFVSGDFTSGLLKKSGKQQKV